MKNTILLIEDENQQLEALQTMFESEGYDVLAAESAEKAMEFLSRTLPNLIITDVKLGGVDGISMFERIRQDHRYQTIPFIFITGYNDPAAIQRVTSFGAAEYVTKPYNLDDLMTRVKIFFPPKEVIVS